MLQISEHLTLALYEMAQTVPRQTDVPPKERQRVAGLVLKTLKKMGRKDLLPYIWIVWSDKLTNTLGLASFAAPTENLFMRVKKKNRPHVMQNRLIKIELSVPLWERATEAQKNNAVIHELSHLITFHEALLQKASKPKAHGSRWKETMLRAGETPTTAHYVDTTGTGKKTKKYKAKCSCKEYEMTPVQAQKIASPHFGVTCRECRQQLTLVDVTPDETQRLAKKGTNRARERAERAQRKKF